MSECVGCRVYSLSHTQPRGESSAAGISWYWAIRLMLVSSEPCLVLQLRLTKVLDVAVLQYTPLAGQQQCIVLM